MNKDLSSKKTSESIFEELFSKKATVIKPGLSRIKEAVTYLNFDLSKRKMILIGGTNGKGSTSGFLWQLLAAAGIKSGLFTSPHLVHYGERFWCNGILPSDKIHRIWTELRTALPAKLYGELSFFEISTLIAFKAFYKLETELDVIEVGLGGRLDSTNVCEPIASVIVSLGIEHEAYLGKGIENITREKLGIARANKPLFVGSIQDQKSAQIIEEYSNRIPFPVFEINKHIDFTQNEIVINLPLHTQIKYKLDRDHQSLPPYKLHNFAIACAVYHWLTESKIIKGPALELLDLTNAAVPPSLIGRFLEANIQINKKSIQAIFDVCHNPHGVAEFCKALVWKFPTIRSRRLPGLVSILHDKDLNTMLDLLKEYMSPLILFKIDHDRTFSKIDLEPRHQHLTIFDSLQGALEHIEALGDVDSCPLIFCGSVLAVGQALEYLDIKTDNTCVERIE